MPLSYQEICACLFLISRKVDVLSLYPHGYLSNQPLHHDNVAHQESPSASHIYSWWDTYGWDTLSMSLPIVRPVLICKATEIHYIFCTYKDQSKLQNYLWKSRPLDSIYSAVQCLQNAKQTLLPCKQNPLPCKLKEA